MDTRQLAAFCAVVERRSFSQAAERLGVTQPAVSLQVRALEKRLRTPPPLPPRRPAARTAAGRGCGGRPPGAGGRVCGGAQRLLALEEQVLSDVVSDAEGDLTGVL